VPVLPSRKQNLAKYYLPSTANLPIEEQAWVMIDMQPVTTADYMSYTDADQNTQVRLARIMLARIHSWNFTNEDGTPVEINMDNFVRIEQLDFEYLKLQKFTDAPQELSDDSKKN
jgi:hypothetical protein